MSYSYVFEANPGELWITIWRGELRLKLYEKDFIEDEKTGFIAKILKQINAFLQNEFCIINSNYLTT